ncbi:uncharacterized protein LOC122857165 isoform X1 [Aphidius gifuensis]|uniref:uncharacterized protein LOC122857165 isoform X1 n=1 Tax=Aphidius gifuensis TaxID=684658 RepID=UPI001CDC3AF2|nr:uncharacterized protein LOC122857165 isoform X1 [Aphidius gifuensis]
MADYAPNGLTKNVVSCGSNIPEVVEGMEGLSVDVEMKDYQPKKYSMRKRVATVPLEMEVRNRRCNMKPKKRSYSTMENDKEIREYYLDKNLKKRTTTTLETIYEEIDGMNENSTVISGRKLKRLIQFNDKNKQMNDAKIKKRKNKIKRSFGSKIRLKTNNISMPAFLKKLNSIMSDSSTPSTSTASTSNS